MAFDWKVKWVCPELVATLKWDDANVRGSFTYCSSQPPIGEVLAIVVRCLKDPACSLGRSLCHSGRLPALVLAMVLITAFAACGWGASDPNVASGTPQATEEFRPLATPLPAPTTALADTVQSTKTGTMGGAVNLITHMTGLHCRSPHPAVSCSTRIRAGT